MRAMFKLVAEVASENMKHLKEKTENSILDVELSDLFARFVNSDRHVLVDTKTIISGKWPNNSSLIF